MKEKWRSGKRRNVDKWIVFLYIRKKVVPDGEEYDTSQVQKAEKPIIF